MVNAKFKALVHFIINECQDNPRKLGAIRLNKTLWYVDAIAFAETGATITESKYIKRALGPVPKHILQITRELQKDGAIIIKEGVRSFDPRKFISLKEPSDDVLSVEDKQLTKYVLSAVLGHTANAISEMTHDIVWEAAQEGEEIPIYATLASRIGKITEEAKNWASEIVSKMQVVA